MSKSAKENERIEQLVIELSKGLQATSVLMQSLLGEIGTNQAALATLKSELENLGSNLRSISKIVRDSDSGNSLVSRITVIEVSIKTIQDWIEDRQPLTDRTTKLEERVANIQNHLEDEREDVKEKRGIRWQVIVALVAGVLGLIGSLISLIK